MKTAAATAGLLALWLGSGALLPAAQAQGINPSRERQRIAADRAAVEARFGERQRACLQRFVVSSCVDDAKRERREALARLRREQNQLDDSVRKARAAERNETIRKRAAAETQRQREARVREPREPARHAPPVPRSARAADAAASPSHPSARGGALPRIAGSPREGPLSGEQETRNRATFDAAHREAEAHRLEVEKRNAERAVKHKPAAPLPLPPGASAP